MNYQKTIVQLDESTAPGLAWSKVLVLGTWCRLSSTWYLLLLGLLKFKSTWYLLVLEGQRTWYLSKYASTFVKLTNIQSWICEFVLFNNSPLNTITRIIEMVRIECADSMGLSMSRLGCLLNLQAEHWDLMTQYVTKFCSSLVQVVACHQFGASHYNQLVKPLQPT